MRSILLLILLIVTPVCLRAQFAFGVGSTGQECGRALITDQSGDIIVAMQFQNTINVDPNGVRNLSSSGQTDIALVRYSQDGQLIWAKRIGGATTTDVPQSIGLDNLGNIYLVGYFGSTSDALPHTADFDPNGGGTLTTKSGYDGFVAKYTSSGTYVWAMEFGSSTSTTDERCWDIAVDTAGYSYVTGAFHGTVDFDPLGLTPVTRITTKTSAGLFLAKYSPFGLNQWVVAVDAGLGNVADEAFTAVDFDPRYGVFWAGNFRGTNVNFYPGGSHTLTSAGETDIFLCGYNILGMNIWAVSASGAGLDLVYPGGMCVNPDGNPFITGRISGAVNFNTSGGSTIVNGASLFVSQYNTKGFLQTVVGFPSDTGCAGHCISFDRQGNMYLAGRMRKTVNFNPGSPYNVTAISSTYDAFLAKYNQQLDFQWVDHFGSASSSGDNVILGLGMDPADFPCVTGQFYGTNVDFDPSPTKTHFLTSAGQGDFFLAKYDDNGAFGPQIPVELQSFEAEPVGEGVMLRWSTAAETDNHGFFVERSADVDKNAETWESIVFIPGNGTSTMPLDYSYLDRSTIAQSGTRIMYRLVQVDLDGTLTKSAPLEVNRGQQRVFEVIHHWPEPASSRQTVSFRTDSDITLRCDIISSTGACISVSEQHYTSGMHSVVLPVETLPNGVYYCRMKVFTTSAGNLVSAGEAIVQFHVMR